MSASGRMLLLLCALQPFGAVDPAGAQQRQGVLHVVWEVSEDPRVAVRAVPLFTDDGGSTVRLVIDDALAAAHGGLLALDRRRVRVALVGPPTAQREGGTPVLGVASITPESPARSPDRLVTAQALQSGSKPYATVLCRFADSTAVSPHPQEFYQGLLTGATAPGISHYWSELSDGRVDLAGSQVAGWYDLPAPRASYFPAGLDKDPDWARMASDCTGVADADLDFSSFFGVNLQFNLHMKASWGGGGYLGRDGVNRVVPMTWMASWASHSTYGHEIGHSFGLPHSSGPYDDTYDSRWDVMSGGGAWEGGLHVGVHTVAYHKGLLGWIPDSRRYVVPAQTARRLRLERSASPGESDYLRVDLPLENQRFYTVEVRDRVGYDRNVPGQAVVIHRVDPLLRDRHARVVDSDGNGDTNDAGAMWVSGETFADSVAGAAVVVHARAGDGFDVTVRRGWELRVDVAGSGTVTSTAAGIDCPSVCSALFGVRGSTVSLEATPASGFLFLGWAGHCTGTGECSVTLNADRRVEARFAEPLVITADSLRPGAVMGAAYRDSLTTRGGVGAPRWQLSSGALPAGLVLESVTGLITGVPTESGEFRFRLRALSEPLSAERAFRLTVTRPTLARQTVLDQLLRGTSALSADEQRFLDLAGNRNGRVDIGDIRAWLVAEGVIAASGGVP